MSRGPAIQEAFRNQMVRAVMGVPPAELCIVADGKSVDDLSRNLADWKQAREMLRAKGWGDFGTSLLEVVNAIPEKAKA